MHPFSNLLKTSELMFPKGRERVLWEGNPAYWEKFLFDELAMVKQE